MSSVAAKSAALGVAGRVMGGGIGKQRNTASRLRNDEALQSRVLASPHLFMDRVWNRA